MPRRSLLLLALASALGCGDAGVGDPAGADARILVPAADAGTSPADAGAPGSDAGAEDAAPPDAGPADAAIDLCAEVLCVPSGPCREAGVCDPATGACTRPARPDGSPCDDGDACTRSDSCQGGSCLGADPISCGPAGVCRLSACDPLTGECSHPVAPDGSPCDDGDGCTRSDRCQGGGCVGADPVTCVASDPCHLAGTCDPATGSCSNPPVVCPASDACHLPGVCDPASGACTYAARPDGESCDDGDALTGPDTCHSGACYGLYGALPDASQLGPADAADAWAALKSLILQCGTGRGSMVESEPGVTTSEYTGLGMLAAVANGDQAAFDGLFKFYKANLDSHGLMHWKVSCTQPLLSGSSTGADLDVAMALVQASCKWPGGTYLQDARILLKSIEPYLGKPGDSWGSSACINPSHFAPGYYRAFAKVAPQDANLWLQAAAAAYSTLNKLAHSTTGLVPDWAVGDMPSSACVGSSGIHFGYEAARVPWRLATDYRWWGSASAKVILDRNHAWIASLGGLSKLTSDVYQLNGTPVGGNYPSSTLRGAFATAAVVADTSKANAYYAVFKSTPGQQAYQIAHKAVFVAFAAGLFERCVH